MKQYITTLTGIATYITSVCYSSFQHAMKQESVINKPSVDTQQLLLLVYDEYVPYYFIEDLKKKS